MINTNTCEFQCWHILGYMRAVLVSRAFVGATEITVGVKGAPSIRYFMRHVIHVCNVIAATCTGRLRVSTTMLPRSVPAFGFVPHFMLVCNNYIFCK